MSSASPAVKCPEAHQEVVDYILQGLKNSRAISSAEYADKTDEELTVIARGKLNKDTIEAYVAQVLIAQAFDPVKLFTILNERYKETLVYQRFATVCNLYLKTQKLWMDGGLSRGNKELIRYMAFGVVYDTFMLPFEVSQLPGLRVEVRHV